MPRLTTLTVIEAIIIGAWFVLAGSFLVQRPDQTHLVPIDVHALSQGALTEDWMGIYFQDQKVGFAVTGTTGTTDGGRIIQSRSSFRMLAFGEVNEIVTAGTALVDDKSRLQRFDFFMSADPVSLSARGEVRDGELAIEVFQAGEAQLLTIPMDEPPQISLTLGPYLSEASGGDLREGLRFEVPYFDPASLAQDVMILEVVDTEILPDGNEAFWVTRSFGDIQTRALITRGGHVLREEGALGLSMVLETREAAQQLPEGQEPVDIISLSAAPLKGRIPDARSRASLTLEFSGVRPDQIRDEPPLQTVEGDRVRVSVPLLEELPDPPRVETSEAMADYLAPTAFIPSAHRDIREQADKLVGDIEGRREAVAVLVDWVFNYLEKIPTMGVPNALEVLQVGQGDCNEHTSLFVGLARAAGIPARIAAGVVYTDRIGDKGAFYYHAWPEVWFGEGGGWVPVEPTFGQFPADATHVKLVEGDLARQIEVMGVMGRIKFKLIESGAEDAAP
jgi:hypothetical protein